MNVFSITSSILILFAVSPQLPPVDFHDRVVRMNDVAFATLDAHSSHRELLMDVAFPNESDDLLPVLVLVKGSNWNHETDDVTEEAMQLFAQGGYFVASIKYRSSDEATFPAAVYYCKAAIRFLRKSATDLRIDPDRIGILGISLAGGHLALLTGVSYGDQFLDGKINGKDISTEVACIASVSGTLRPQFAKSDVLERFLQWVLARRGDKIEPALPETYIDSGDPPIYLLCGELDPDAPINDAQSFCTILQKDSVPYELDIVDDAFRSLSFQPTDYLGVLGFLDAHLGGRCKEALELQL